MAKKKKVYTLVQDIKDLILNGKENIDKDNLNNFLDTMREEMERFLSPYEGERQILGVLIVNYGTR